MEKPFASCIVLDGPAIVNTLQPKDCSTFKDYSLKVFCPLLSTQLEACERIDIIWDRYFKNTLQAKARKKRGSGVRRRIQHDSKIPGNLQPFLRVDESKEKLFEFLATESVNMQTNKAVISTKGESIISNNDFMVHFSHENKKRRILGYFCMSKMHLQMVTVQFWFEVLTLMWL